MNKSFSSTGQPTGRSHQTSAWLCLVFVFSLSACVPNKMYRVDNVERRSNHTMTYVEFDEQGDLWSESQLSRTLATIEQANRNPRGSVVFLFIHGWYHNASEGDSNIEAFSGLLEGIVESTRQNEAETPEMVGVYLGWRGKTIIEPLNVLSFYTRAFATSRIAGSTATEVILRIMTTAKRNPNSKVILVGHSFGGQILESAVTQALVGAVLAEEEGDIEIPADLIMLVNPAAKAVQTKQFIEVLARNRIKLYRTDVEGNRYEVPLIVSVTSVGDLATRVAFPAGVYVMSLFKRYRKYTETDCSPIKSQRSVYAHTSGHMRPLQSHVITAEPLPEGVPSPAMLDTSTIQRRFDPVTRQDVYTFDGERHHFTIRRRPRAHNNTPYWVMRVPRSLIPNHSAIFRFNTVRLMVAIFATTGALQPGATSKLVRETGVEPTALAALSSGRVLFAERSRRVYDIRPDAEHPIFVSCLPRIARPADRIGFSTRENRFWSVTNSPKEGSDDEFDTHIVIGELGKTRFLVEKDVELTGNRRFIASAVDAAGGRVFLSTEKSDEIYVADLTRAREEPRLLSRIGGAGALSALIFDHDMQRLLALDGEKGLLYGIDPSVEPARVVVLASGLGRPTAVVVDEARSVIFIADATARHLWSVNCDRDLKCKTLRPFAKRMAVSAQVMMTVATDGTLWVADPAVRKITGLSPAGDVVRVIDRLHRE